VGGIDFKPLSLFEAVYLVIAVIATLAAVFTIRALIRQSRVASQAAVAAAQISVDGVFVNHPHLRRYFLGGEDVLPESQDYQQAAAVAQMLLNYFESYFRQRTRNDQLYDDETWLAYMADHFRGSPLLLRLLEQHASWYTEDLIAFAQSIPLKHPTLPASTSHAVPSGSVSTGPKPLPQIGASTPADKPRRRKRP